PSALSWNLGFKAQSRAFCLILESGGQGSKLKAEPSAKISLGVWGSRLKAEPSALSWNLGVKAQSRAFRLILESGGQGSRVKGKPGKRMSSPDSSDGTSVTAAFFMFFAVVMSILVVVLIFRVMKYYCAKKVKRAIVRELLAAVAPPAYKAVEVWNVDAPTMETFLQEVARQKPVRFTAQQLCIGRRRNTNISPSESLDWFPKHVWEECEKNDLESMTVACGIEEKDREKAIRMSMIALWCVQDSPEARPPMSVVVKMLEGGVEIMPPPKPFHYLYSIGMEALKPPESGSSDLTSEETNSYWYNDSTPIMTKYEIQIASS
ncbi:rust resistance kinase Lr10-like, partial [Fagus crenata]